MGSRWYTVLVVLLWAVAMGWLVIFKIAPMMRDGAPPDPRPRLPAPGEGPVLDGWRIYWNDRQLGWSATKARRNDDDSSEIQTSVHFDRLPAGEMLSQLLGPGGRLLSWASSEGPLEFSVDVRSTVLLSNTGQVEQFDASFDIDRVPDLVILRGRRISEKQMTVSIFAPLAGQHRPTAGKPFYETTIDLPRSSRLNDPLSPTNRLVALYPGQTWTAPVFTPFPPGSPPDWIRAVVEKRDFVFWNGDSQEALLVVLRRVEGSQVSAADKPLGRMWVAPGGMVLVQELELGDTPLRFVRLPEENLPKAARAALGVRRDTDD